MALLVMQVVIVRLHLRLFPIPEKVTLILVMRIANETMIAFHDF